MDLISYTIYGEVVFTHALVATGTDFPETRIRFSTGLDWKAQVGYDVIQTSEGLFNPDNCEPIDHPKHVVMCTSRYGIGTRGDSVIIQDDNNLSLEITIFGSCHTIHDIQPHNLKQVTRTSIVLWDGTTYLLAPNGKYGLFTDVLHVSKCTQAVYLLCNNQSSTVQVLCDNRNARGRDLARRTQTRVKKRYSIIEFSCNPESQPHLKLVHFEPREQRRLERNDLFIGLGVTVQGVLVQVMINHTPIPVECEEVEGLVVREIGMVYDDRVDVIYQDLVTRECVHLDIEIEHNGTISCKKVTRGVVSMAHCNKVLYPRTRPTKSARK